MSDGHKLEPFFSVGIVPCDEGVGLEMKLSAATEMYFVVKIDPEDEADHDRLFVDVCRLAPALMRADSVLAEEGDGEIVSPDVEDLMLIARFGRTYGQRIVRSDIPVARFYLGGAKQ